MSEQDKAIRLILYFYKMGAVTFERVCRDNSDLCKEEIARLLLNDNFELSDCWWCITADEWEYCDNALYNALSMKR